MIKELLLPILLFFVGICGNIISIILNKDEATLIIIGFGGGMVLLHNKIKEGNIDVRNPFFIRLLVVVIAIIAALSISYNAYRFNSNYNRVFLAAFIILMIWEVVLVFIEIKGKQKK